MLPMLSATKGSSTIAGRKGERFGGFMDVAVVVYISVLYVIIVKKIPKETQDEKTTTCLFYV